MQRKPDAEFREEVARLAHELATLPPRHAYIQIGPTRPIRFVVTEVPTNSNNDSTIIE